jgi:hypothetical protein
VSLSREIDHLHSRPKRKHIVLPSWVDECLGEETLMNEDGESNFVLSLLNRQLTIEQRTSLGNEQAVCMPTILSRNLADITTTLLT